MYLLTYDNVNRNFERTNSQIIIILRVKQRYRIIIFTHQKIDNPLLKFKHEDFEISVSYNSMKNQI